VHFLSPSSSSWRAPGAHAKLLGPTGYLSQADSPFNADIVAGTTTLETFEDGDLDTTFGTTTVVASAGGVLVPGFSTDSVDADDGAIDGSGTAGRSFFSTTGGPGIAFTFGGTLPTQAGIVWTDGLNPITFEAFGPGNVLLASITTSHADGNFLGGTGEDRFYGVENLGPISRIHIRSSVNAGIEADHLQFGNPAPPTQVPAPATLLLLGVGMAIGAAIRTRRAL
jgi:hypothetical protein